MKISAVWGLVASALVARGVEAKVEIDVNNRGMWAFFVGV